MLGKILCPATWHRSVVHSQLLYRRDLLLTVMRLSRCPPSMPRSPLAATSPLSTFSAGACVVRPLLDHRTVLCLLSLQLPSCRCCLFSGTGRKWHALFFVSRRRRDCEPRTMICKQYPLLSPAPACVFDSSGGTLATAYPPLASCRTLFSPGS